MKFLSRIETKVWAGAAGAFAGIGALTPTALWLLGVFVFHGSRLAANADATIAAVPWPVALAVTTLLGGGTAGVAAYKAPPSNHAGNYTPTAGAPDLSHDPQIVALLDDAQEG